MSDFDVGERFKTLRKQHGYSQRQLAEKSGVTNGLISMIEANKTNPSITSIKKILTVFDMSLVDFFEAKSPKQDKFVFRPDELTEISPERVFNVGSPEGLSAVSLKRIGSGKDSDLLMLYEVYEQGADTGPEPYTHDGEEAGFVIEGELLLEVGDRTETLRAGDSYQFESRIPHRFRNVGKKRCVVVSACTPPSF